MSPATIKNLADLPIAEATIKDIIEILTRPATIVKTLKGLGYETEVVKEKLLKYHEPLTKENMSEVIKWLISQM